MTLDSDDTIIPDADHIIEKFGGIRPMAAKLGVPVTTVQGWKKRNAIPGNRRHDIVRAAAVHNINLGSLLIGLTRRAGASGIDTATEQLIRPAAVAARLDDDMIAPAQPPVGNSQSQAIVLSSVALLGVVALGAFLFVGPAHKVVPVDGGQQAEKIAALQREIENLKAAQAETATIAESAADAEMPAVIKDQLDQVQSTMQQLQDKAESMGHAIDGFQVGDIKERLSSIEAGLKSAAGEAQVMGLSGLLSRISALQQTPDGQAILSAITGSFSAAGAATSAQGDDAQNQAFEALRAKDPILGQALQGVAPEDMKAAAMLIGFAQLRSALARDNASFENDLKLLESVAAGDDPALKDAIGRLSTQAKGGVLTPDGLSKEFRSLAGDIVVSSLKGEDVSVQEKAKARLGEILKVDKNGQQITGTETQIAVAQAQKLLDQGDVAGAVQLLQGLQGPASDAAQPFMQQAEMTMLAQQVRQALGNNILGALSARQQAVPSSSVLSSGLGSVIHEVQQMIPGYGMAHDPASGFRIYRPVPIPQQNSLSGAAQ